MRLLLTVAAAVVLAACDSQIDDPGPTDLEPFALTVTVTDDGRPVAGADVYLVFGPADGARPPARAQRGGASFLSDPYPNPWFRSTSLRLAVDEESRARIDLVDVRGQRVRTVLDRVLTAGSYGFAVPEEDSLGSALPGGVYQFRAVLGADTLSRWTAHTDYGLGDRPDVARRIGRSGPDGAVTLLDRSAVPAFYDVPELVWTDDSGFELGTFTLTEEARVLAVVDGNEAEAAVTLSDGPNSVTVSF